MKADCNNDLFSCLQGAETGGITDLRELAMLLANSQAEIEYGLGEAKLREGACYSGSYLQVGARSRKLLVQSSNGAAQRDPCRTYVLQSCKYGQDTYTHHYCGRGFLQLTWCGNYVGAQRYLEQVSTRVGQPWLQLWTDRKCLSGCHGMPFQTSACGAHPASMLSTDLYNSSPQTGKYPGLNIVANPSALETNRGEGGCNTECATQNVHLQ